MFGYKCPCKNCISRACCSQNCIEFIAYEKVITNVLPSLITVLVSCILLPCFIFLTEFCTYNPEYKIIFIIPFSVGALIAFWYNKKYSQDTSKFGLLILLCTGIVVGPSMLLLHFILNKIPVRSTPGGSE